MRLAGDEIVIGFSGARFRLRCCLRAAAHLLEKHESPANLIALIHAGGLTACLDVIRECADDSRCLALVTTQCSEKGLADSLWPHREALIAFVLRLYGASETDADSSATTGKPMTHAEFIERLFAIGTGWLQWSPSETWNASVAEILIAKAALIEKLKAIHGSKEDNEQTIDATDGGLASNVKAELNALGDLGVTSANARAS